MAVSRTELLGWVNDLLQTNYTKVEQLGSGGAYCQIMDSIYGDVNMARVKMNAKQEYEYLSNFKILQTFFKAKKIDKPIPMEKLVKCKALDNLEFLQWIKRFWDSNYGGHEYDPVARRKGAAMEPPATVAPLSTGGSRGGLSVASAARTGGGKTPVGGYRSSSTQPNEAVLHLQGQVKELSGHLEGLEKERDFYFEKLREIEILVQQQLEGHEAEAKPEDDANIVTLKEIQKILYSTEDGFEVPEGGAPLEDEEETF